MSSPFQNLPFELINTIIMMNRPILPYHKDLTHMCKDWISIEDTVVNDDNTITSYIMDAREIVEESENFKEWYFKAKNHYNELTDLNLFEYQDYVFNTYDYENEESMLDLVED